MHVAQSGKGRGVVSGAWRTGGLEDWLVEEGG
jgi:hypothetical protein